MEVAGIDAISRFLNPIGIHTVFAIAAFTDEISVFAIGDGFAILAVFGIYGDDTHLRRRVHELVELLEERSTKVVVAAFAFVIP